MECRNFTGQPIYAQIAKYLSKGEILRLKILSSGMVSI